MDIQPPDYDKVEMDLWRKHGSEVIDLLNNHDRGLMRRIRTFCERFGFDEKDVRQKIEDDFMFACCFAKNPTRTKLHEKEAEKYLRMFPNLIHTFKSLPSSGKNALYINQEGNIVTGKSQEGIKSLDFMWKVVNSDITCIAAHKFTRERGGAQDPQRNELMRLLELFKLCDDEKIAFFAICDGPYYDDRTLSMLRQHVNKEPPYSFACPIGDVPKNVEKLLAN